MKLRNLVPYLVTKGNTDGSVLAGDIVWLGKDKSLSVAGNGNGWIPVDEQTESIMDFQAEERTEYILQIRGSSEMLIKK